MKNEIICPHCKNEDVVKRGFRQTENRGLIQRYYCKSCGFRFIRDSFFRMRNTPQKITLCLDLFYKGISTREIQNHLQAFYPHNSDHSTILRWIRKYSVKISKFTDALKINAGDEIEVDEMEHHRRKSHKAKRGSAKNWLINAIDIKTRFLLLSQYEKSRGTKEMKDIFKKVKFKTDNKIKTVTTDSLPAYANVLKNVYGYTNLKKGLIVHNKSNSSKGDGFNIMIERLNNSIRARTKTMRGFHGSIESANALMKGFEIYYNFIRKHQSLKGKTPSEMAIPSLEFKTPNRWLELINMATQNN